MPRKNNYPKQNRVEFIKKSSPKRRFPTKKAAENAAELGMLENQNLVLSVYRDIDGGWYLTSRPPVIQ